MSQNRRRSVEERVPAHRSMIAVGAIYASHGDGGMLLMFETKRTAISVFRCFDKCVLGHVPCGPELEVVAWRASWAP